MHDLKNILLAWISSASAVMTAVEVKSFMTILSAIILPAIFFALGKAIDIGVQIYLRRRDGREPQRRGDAEAK
jgi:hypothetical protein